MPVRSYKLAKERFFDALGESDVRLIKHGPFQTLTGWCNGVFTYRHRYLSEAPLLYAAMAVFVTHLRIPHFYAIHRAMHPWRVR